jgi:acyl-CoA thioesterase
MPTALAVAQQLYSQDQASQALGMVLLAADLGAAQMQMTVRPDMINGVGTCHGGLIFTLADSTFAFACNSHNLIAVANGCSIEFLSPAKLGDVLTATATEQIVRGRQGVYDIAIANQTGELIALFRGKSTRIPGQIIPT